MHPVIDTVWHELVHGYLPAVFHYFMDPILLIYVPAYIHHTCTGSIIFGSPLDYTHAPQSSDGNAHNAKAHGHDKSDSQSIGSGGGGGTLSGVWHEGVLLPERIHFKFGQHSAWSNPDF